MSLTVRYLIRDGHEIVLTDTGRVVFERGRSVLAGFAS